MKKNDKHFSLKEVIIISIIISFFMFFLGSLSIYRHLGGINYTLLGNDKDLKKFISTYENLINNYYGDIDRSMIISGAINGLYKSLNDPYTTYLDTNSTNALNETLNSQYVGIGIRIEDRDKDAVVTEVFDSSPAYNAGLKVGDIIIKLNGIDVSELYSIDISELIKASESEIVLDIKRNGNIKTFSLTSAELLVSSVNKEILEYNNKKIGYIYISIFNDTADIQFEDALSQLEKNTLDALILDLRNNAGGYLEVTKNIAEMFIKKGAIIYTLVNKSQKLDFTDITNESRSYKIIVLVNSQTASAAEILAGALKHSYGASIVGNQTYGKGKVQQKADLIDGTSIKYTTAKWLMPNGECIDGIGIKPDYEINIDKTTLDKNDLYTDSQILYVINNLVD